MGAIAARMHDPLGNALVVEMEDLLAEMEVFDEGRAAGADSQRVLVVGDRAALRGGQHRRTVFGNLMQFAAFAALQFLIVNRRVVRGRGLGGSSWPSTFSGKGFT